MKVAAFLALAFVAVALGRVTFEAHTGKDIIENEYIVRFHNSVSETERAAHFGSIQTTFSGEEGITHKYNMAGFSGYAATLDKESLSAVLAAGDVVAAVEANQRAYATSDVNAATCETYNLPQGLWGLSRTMQTDLPLQYLLEVDPTVGRDVDAYIIDTGVLCSHNEFTGRCHAGYDEYPSEGGSDKDLNGHGTHVAGTVAGTTFGFCKACSVYGVKVLSRSGSGSFAGVIAGIDWVANRGGSRRRVANLSLGGGFSAAVNAAVDAAVDAGVVMVVASGNNNRDACNYSPASAEKAITVNSMQIDDRRSSFSNFGTCTQIFAPGTNILSAWIGSNSASSTISGTSMAAPHVAGVVAMAMGEPGAPSTPQGILDAIIRDSSKDKVTNPGTGSPNNLVFHACLD